MNTRSTTSCDCSALPGQNGWMHMYVTRDMGRNTQHHTRCLWKIGTLRLWRELTGGVAILWGWGSTLLQHLVTRNATTCDFSLPVQALILCAEARTMSH